MLFFPWPSVKHSPEGEPAPAALPAMFVPAAHAEPAGPVLTVAAAADSPLHLEKTR